MSEINSNFKLMVEIPDDEDPEYYYENITQKYQDEIRNKINKIQEQNQKILELSTNNQNITKKVKELINHINTTKNQTEEIRKNQNESMLKLRDFYENTHKLNQTSHSLKYVNTELDKLIKHYKLQKEQNIKANTDFEKLYQKLPTQTIELQPYEPILEPITIEEIVWNRLSNDNSN